MHVVAITSRGNSAIRIYTVAPSKRWPEGYDHVERARTRTPGGLEEPVMTSRKLDEVAADIDDASTTVDELQVKPDQDTDTTDKLDELHDALEHASDTLDDIENSDEIDDKDGGS
jgi:hypothetical protein